MRTTRQGTFDGLCGVYAILNALDPAGLKLPRCKLHADLFKEITHGLGAVALLSAMHDGLGTTDLMRGAIAAFRWLALEHNVHLSIEAPYLKRRFKTPRDFIDTLRLDLDADRQAVVTYVMMPGRDHWTVPTAIVGQKLLLRDSGGLASLPLKQLTAPSSSMAFSIPDTLLIRRHDRGDAP